MKLEEIAKLSGVSRSTVSRVVNGDPHVSKQARARVQSVIEETKFYPNAAARSLASRRTRVIGLLIPKAIGSVMTDPFFLYLVQGAVAECNDADYLLTLLFDHQVEDLDNDRIYQRIIKGRHVDGIVIVSSVVEDPMVVRLQKDGFPFVLVGRNPKHDVSFVDVDNLAASRKAVLHLLEHGYRRIGTIMGPQNLIASIDRYAGYVGAMQEMGLPVDKEITVAGDFSRRSGYRAMKVLLSADHRPEAVFVASDTMASGALQAIRDAGLSAPQNIAVFGFDGLEHEQVSQPILSTVVQPIGALGAEAVQVLLNRIESPESAPVQRYLDTHLRLRTSCGCDHIHAASIRGSPEGGETQLLQAT
jgi:LacI family transcriptional regulator, galactose operon repressor